jgi:uncharacterized protein
MFAAALSHLLVVYLVVVMPWWTVYFFEKARKRIQAGIPDARMGVYRETLIEQIIGAVAVLALMTNIPADRLGLSAPRSWVVTIAVFVGLAAVVVWSSLRARPLADKIRKQARSARGFLVLVPETPRERTWYGAVSVGAGIWEELAYRGFLLYYLALYLPQLNALERDLLAALVFGVAHVYQGWKGATGAGIMGLAFVGLYALAGSLLLPIVVHIAMDWRLLLMLPPVETQPKLAETSI